MNKSDMIFIDMVMDRAQCEAVTSSMPCWQRVYLGLGGNMGDRVAMMQAAHDMLVALPELHVSVVSQLYESEAMGMMDQSPYINLTMAVETERNPLELLHMCKEIEKRLGRHDGPRWGPRPVDIDLLLWENRVVDIPDLTIPHRAFRHRAFVLVPLVEIAPDLQDPITGYRIAELVAKVDTSGIRPYPERLLRV